MLDRLALLVPDWRERNPADLGVTLVELLAYVGDHLSYQQDAVATEAYLGTARRRVSVRRHARLVDYAHARRLQRARLGARSQVDRPTGRRCRGPATRFYTRVPGAADRDRARLAGRLRRALRQRPEVFEPLHAGDAARRAQRARVLHLGRRALLPAAGRDARRRSRGHLPDLRAGRRRSLFEEVLGPATGDAGRRRSRAPPRRAARPTVHAVTVDGALPPLDRSADRHSRSPRSSGHAEDALPFPLCISARTDEAHGAASSTTSASRAATSCSPTTAARCRRPRRSARCRRRGCTTRPIATRSLRAARADAGAAALPAAARAAPLTQAGTCHATVDGGRSTTSALPFDPGALRRRAMRGAWTMRCRRSTLAARSAGDRRTGTPRRDLLDQRRPTPRVRGRGRGRRHARAALRRRRARPRAPTRARPSPRATASATARPATSAPTRSRTSSRSTTGIVRRAQSAGRRAAASTRSRRRSVRRTRPQAFRTPGARGDAGGLRGGDRARMPGVQRAAATLRWTGAGTRCSSPSTARRRAASTPTFEPTRRAPSSSATAWPGTTSRSTIRVYVPLEIDAARLRAGRATSAADVDAALLDVLSNRVAARRPARPLPSRQLHASARPVYLSPLYAAARRCRASTSVQVDALPAPGHRGPGRARRTAACRSAGSRSRASTTTRTSPSTACSRLTLHGGK